MKNVYLHGYLGKMFGKRWTLDVRTPAEAIRAIDANLNGKLRNYWIGDGRAKKYTIKIGSYGLTDQKEITSNCGERDDIHITPYSGGSKSGFAKVLVAIVIIVAAYYGYGGGSEYAGKAGEAAGTGLFGSTAAATASMGYQIGAALLLGGVMQLLSPVPNFNTDAGNDNRSSLFDGNGLYMMQGSTVPLVYGRMLVAPMPVSVSLSNVDKLVPGHNAGGCYDPIAGEMLEGGSMQYVDGQGEVCIDTSRLPNINYGRP